MNYQKIYDQIIEQAKHRQLEGYKEKHHIIPRCLNGNNDKENLVKLTAREHFLCHKLLVNIYPKEYKLKQALWLMAIQMKSKGIKVNSKEYEKLKLDYILTVKNKIKHTPESKQKIRESRLNKKMSIESKIKMSENRKGKIIINAHKSIIQYDKYGNFIKEWTGALQIKQELNIDCNRISACCRGINKSANGFIWKYKKIKETIFS